MALATHRMIENRGSFINEEYVLSGGSVYPGMLMQLNSSGLAVVHAIVGGATPLMIADLDALQGSITSTVFVTANSIPVTFPSKGSVVNVLVVSGQTVSIGSHLVSDGTGKFAVIGDGTSGDQEDVVLLEAIEGQATALAADTLVAARVL